jgi:pimeloyl-ACP methyl ester carboxylesterase
VNNLKIHYQVCGALTAPPLVLLHGLGGSTNWWRANLSEFSQHYRTYALDLPGFGRSKRLPGFYNIDRAVEFVLTWLELLALKPLCLLGHSMGGEIAVRLTAQHPDIVKRLVLVAPAGLWLPTGERLRWFKEAPKVKIPLSQSLTIAGGTMKTDLVALFQSLVSLLADKKGAESLKRLTTPTLILWGAGDAILPPTLGQRNLELITKVVARLVLIDNGTHDVMMDQAQVFNKLVLDFLGEE